MEELESSPRFDVRAAAATLLSKAVAAPTSSGSPRKAEDINPESPINTTLAAVCTEVRAKLRQCEHLLMQLVQGGGTAAVARGFVAALQLAAAGVAGRDRALIRCNGYQHT